MFMQEKKTGRRFTEKFKVKAVRQWCFDMKAHVSVETRTGSAHTKVTTAVIELDVSRAHKLPHEKKHVHADAGYQGAHKREELKDYAAGFVITRRRSTYKKLDEADPVRRLIEQSEHAKANFRTKVEHVFHVVKNPFCSRKGRYKVLAKSTAQLHVLFAIANLVLTRRTLCAPYRAVAS